MHQFTPYHTSKWACIIPCSNTSNLHYRMNCNSNANLTRVVEKHLVIKGWNKVPTMSPSIQTYGVNIWFFGYKSWRYNKILSWLHVPPSHWNPLIVSQRPKRTWFETLLIPASILKLIYHAKFHWWHEGLPERTLFSIKYLGPSESPSQNPSKGDL